MPQSAFSPQPSAFTESVVEDATLDWFAELGYTVAHGPDLAPDGIAAERASYGDVVLVDRRQDMLLPQVLSGEVRVKDVEEKQ